MGHPLPSPEAKLAYEYSMKNFLWKQGAGEPRRMTETKRWFCCHKLLPVALTVAVGREEHKLQLLLLISKDVGLFSMMHV